MRVVALVGFAVALTSAQAGATEGFNCTIDDAQIAVDASATFSSGNGQPFFDLKAKAQINGEDVPDDFRTIDLTQSLKHHWFEAGDLRLRFYYEREGEADHASVELIIKTTGEGDDPELTGTYKVIIVNTDPEAKDTLFYEGPASCSAG